MYSNLHAEVLSKQELRALIRKAQRRVAALEAASIWRDVADDERVVAAANAILMLAYKSGVPKDDVFRLVAGALRLPVRDVALSTEELKAVDSSGDNVPASAGEGGEPVEPGSGESAEDSQPRAEQNLSSLSDQPQCSSRSLSGTSRPRAEPADSVRPYHRRSASTAHNDKSAEGRHKERPLYVHPANKDQYWDGQGEMPKWLRDAIAFGRSLEEFRA